VTYPPPVRVLGVIRGRRDPPGSLARTDDLGGAWVHLLPRLALGRVALVRATEPGLAALVATRATTLVVMDQIPHEPPDVDLLIGGPGAAADLEPWASSVLAAGGIVVRENVGTRRSAAAAISPHDTVLAVHPVRGPVRAAWPEGDESLSEWLSGAGLRSDAATRARMVSAARRARRLFSRSGSPDRPSTRRGASAGEAALPTRRARRMLRSVAWESARRVVAGVGRIEAAVDRLQGRSRRLVLRGVAPGPPAWLRDVAAESLPGDDYRVALAAPGEFPTQKIVLALTAVGEGVPDTIVKVGRHRLVDERIATAVSALEVIAANDLVLPGTVPAIRFAGTSDDVLVSGEQAFQGEGMNEASWRSADCPWGATARAWILDLGRRSVRPGAAGELADALHDLQDQLPSGLLSQDEQTVLSDLAEQLRPLAVPTVMLHGDPGPWNMRVDVQSGRLCVLDWENGEPRGVPLWDLLYFLRSFGISVAGQAATGDRLERGLHWLRDPALAAVTADAVARYVREVGIPAAAVRPIFFHVWTYQALKEAARVPSADASRNIFLRTLRWLVAHRDAPAVNQAIGPRRA